MKTLLKLFVFSFIFFISCNVHSQAHADLGIRINSAEYNRIQLEFRKPMNEKYMMRFGLSQGQWSGYHYNVVSAASDSVVTFREKSGYGINFDFRYGFERKLKDSNFSLHGDFILAYNKLDYQNWDSFNTKDSSNVWNQTYEYMPSSQNYVRVQEHLLGGGMALGVSYNYPLSEHFIVNFNFNYTGLVRFNIAHHETSDFLNEFYDGGGTRFDLYVSAGLGLRYVFIKKEVSSGKG